MKIESLRDLYVDEMRDLYDAEKQLTSALPKLAKAASSSKLREAFEGHLQETEGHVKRLAQIFEALGEKPKGKACKAMQGLIKEGDEVVKKSDEWEPSIVDAALIVAAQKVEHYEISGYGSLRAFASLLGEKEAVELLQETLDEESDADKTLTDIASEVNVEANEHVTQET